MSDEEPKHEPTLPGVGEKAESEKTASEKAPSEPARSEKKSEKTVLGVGGPMREQTVPGVAFDPSLPPARAPMATIIGVGEEASPAHLRLVLESSVSMLPPVDSAPALPAVVPEPPPVPAAPPAPASPPPAPVAAAPAAAPASPPPAPVAAAPASPPPAPVAAAPAAAPAARPPRVSEDSESSLHPAGAPRSGLATMLIVLALFAGSVAAYLHRDEIMEHISPPAPSAAMNAEPAPSALPLAAPKLEEAGPTVASERSPDGAGAGPEEKAAIPSADLDAAASKDAATAKDAGAKDAATPRDAGAPKTDAGVKGAASTKPPVKPLLKPPPPKPEPKPEP